MEIDATELFLSEGLLCLIYDYDKIGGNEKLGSATIPPRTLYEAKGQRMEFKLGPAPGHTKEVPGFLAIRCRRATDYDVNFLKSFQAGKTGMGHFLGLTAKEAKTATHSKGGSGNIKSMLTRTTKVEKEGKNAGIRQVRIRIIHFATS
jgi:hypothetical protein